MSRYYRASCIVFPFAALLASLRSLHVITSLFSHLGCVRIDRIFTFHKAAVIILFFRDCQCTRNIRYSTVAISHYEESHRYRVAVGFACYISKNRKKNLFSRVASQHRDDYGAIAVYATIAAIIMIPFVSLRNDRTLAAKNAWEIRKVANQQRDVNGRKTYRASFRFNEHAEGCTHGRTRPDTGGFCETWSEHVSERASERVQSHG